MKIEELPDLYVRRRVLYMASQDRRSGETSFRLIDLARYSGLCWFHGATYLAPVLSSEFDVGNTKWNAERIDNAELPLFHYLCKNK